MSVRNPQTPEEWAIRREQRQRSYAKRKARVALANRRGSRCQFRKGRYGLCNDLVREVVDRFGKVHLRCEACDRRQEGICRTCPRNVAGRVGWAYYCAECKKRAAAEYNRRWVRQNRARKNASVRKWRKRNAMA